MGLNHLRLEVESQQKRSQYEKEAESLYTNFIAPSIIGTDLVYPISLIYYQYSNLLSAKTEYTRSIQAINSSASILLGIYLINIGDAYIFHPGGNFFTYIEPTSDGGIALRMTWNF
jgi:hypothetical protein